MVIRVQIDQCTGCGSCLEVCPTNAISIEEGVAFVDQDHCRGCQVCQSVCQYGALIEDLEATRSKMQHGRGGRRWSHR